MNCKSVQNQLSAYLDREVAGDEMLAIRAHLHDCDECRDEAEALKMLKRMLTESPVPEPSADFADRLCAAVLSSRTSMDVEKRDNRITLRASLITFSSVAAFSMALTFAALTNSRPGSSPTAVPMSVDTASSHDLAFQVQRDQMWATGLDSTSGVPVISSPSHARR
ncbi:anti-sigma factor family protein [Fimbriimonas ginsengisoli]|uniref:Putative transmembrane anti-sigma factor n=1 Tax=Fimbriimonas ginsengisoli Gsoil 348 TaxID=661478 RepID=A0A068NN06_FIMGI|nr:zf-HC2 domain-containing protein [Fimbriimonas ginsengisoli]AIE84943.1 putative transmembrane anti-sigma factor [Fimbriimonas ginsengisoli Gsoil 348]